MEQPINMNVNKEENRKGVFETIKEMENLIDVGFKVPPFGTMVSAKSMREHITRLKKQIRVELEEADHLMVIQDKIIADAHAQADEIVQKRQREISKQSIIQDAEGIARKVLEEAHKEAKRIKDEANKFQEELVKKSYGYADRIFDQLEQDLANKRQNVAENRRDLQLVLKLDNNNQENRKLS